MSFMYQCLDQPRQLLARQHNISKNLFQNKSIIKIKKRPRICKICGLEMYRNKEQKSWCLRGFRVDDKEETIDCGVELPVILVGTGGDLVSNRGDIVLADCCAKRTSLGTKFSRTLTNGIHDEPFLWRSSWICVSSILSYKNRSNDHDNHQ